jgi:hypothetical protein
MINNYLAHAFVLACLPLKHEEQPQIATGCRRALTLENQQKLWGTGDLWNGIYIGKWYISVLEVILIVRLR